MTYIPMLVPSMVFWCSFVISSEMKSSLKAASLAVAKKRSYGKDTSQWSLWVGKWTLPALLLLACSGQTESCDWHRTELGRAYATSAWLWLWQTLWPRAARGDFGLPGSMQVLWFPVWLLPSHFVVPYFIPCWNRDQLHHHTELFVSTKKTKALKYYRMGGIYTVL